MFGRKENEIYYEIWSTIVLLACGFVLFAAAFEYLYSNTEGELVLRFRHFCNLLCVIFFANFIRKYVFLRKEYSFWRWGWVDLLICVPYFTNVKYFTLFVQICFLLRILRCIEWIFEFLFKGKTKALISSASTLLFSSILISAGLVFKIESASEFGNIKSMQDALWWAFGTVTTVGYGDKFPTTLDGRLVGIALMFVGISLFGMLSALLASWLLRYFVNTKEDSNVDEIAKSVKEIKDLLSKRLP